MRTAVARPHRAEGHPTHAEPSPPPPSVPPRVPPGRTPRPRRGALAPPLRAMTVKPAATRRPASLLHKALHVPVGSKVVRYAKHFLGVPYVWGGSSPRGFA